jgi:flap endonuclease-1
MGIRNLNRFLNDHAANSIKLCNLGELSGKTIAVDISIYLYKFSLDDTLIENIYLMLAIFKHYDIKPIFIFDGKPPPEKYELLQKRKEDKKEAEDKYLILQQTLTLNKDMNNADKQELIYNMDMLKKNFISISKRDIETVKNIITAYGATYYDAIGEADELCALLTIKNKVWACLSEDMDMFVYGCPRVIRYISLLKHTAVLYDVKDILINLGITQKELREICIISGTDYNLDCVDNNSLITNLKYFKKYHKSKSGLNFYEWLKINRVNVIKDFELLTKINEMFDLTKNNYNSKMFDKMKTGNGHIIKDDLSAILKTVGFLV